MSTPERVTPKALATRCAELTQQVEQWRERAAVLERRCRLLEDARQISTRAFLSGVRPAHVGTSEWRPPKDGT